MCDRSKVNIAHRFCSGLDPLCTDFVRVLIFLSDFILYVLVLPSGMAQKKISDFFSPKTASTSVLDGDLELDADVGVSTV